MKLTITGSISVFLILMLTSFKFSDNGTSESQSSEGVFICNVNGKEVFLKGAKAQFRTITGGHKQLSLSNDKFEAFVFINPAVKKVELEEKNNRQVYVRYIEPGTDKVYKPSTGFVDIQSFDLEKGLVSGVFEMVLINRDGPEKKITVKNGKFENIPIREIGLY